MFYEALSQSTLGILKSLSEVDYIKKEFYLAGGTGLALQIGHRLSYDLDFFCYDDITQNELDTIFNSKNAQKIYQSHNTFWYKLDNIDISFIKYPYGLIDECKSFYDIKIASLKDIFAMKIMAIIQRGAKKDFYDVYELFNQMNIKEIKTMLVQKYGINQVNFYQLVKALNYFADADNNPDVISLKSISWEQVKSYFVDNYNNISKQFLEN